LTVVDELVAEFPTEPRYRDRQALSHANLGIVLSQAGQFQEVEDICRRIIAASPTSSVAHNNLAWLLATCPDVRLRDPVNAVKLAQKAVDLAPKDGNSWNTLGVARYRAGSYTAAIAALEESKELLGDAESSVNDFFLAMAQWQSGRKDEAVHLYDQAVRWMETNRPRDGELGRFRAEAEELLKTRKDAKPK